MTENRKWRVGVAWKLCDLRLLMDLVLRKWDKLNKIREWYWPKEREWDRRKKRKTPFNNDNSLSDSPETNKSVLSFLPLDPIYWITNSLELMWKISSNTIHKSCPLPFAKRKKKEGKRKRTVFVEIKSKRANERQRWLGGDKRKLLIFSLKRIVSLWKTFNWRFIKWRRRYLPEEETWLIMKIVINWGSNESIATDHKILTKFSQVILFKWSNCEILWRWRWWWQK